MNQWEKAMDLDIHLISEYPGCKDITEQLFEEICKTLTIRNKARSRETLQLAVINLWLSCQTGLPVKYSRNRRAYQHHQRYGRLHIRYDRLIPIIDELERLGYVIQRIGFYDRAKGFGRRTRMVPTPKLIRLFQERIPTCTEVVQKAPPEQIVQLKNTDKILIDYPETRSVKGMRTRLRRYNEFISEQSVEVVIPEDVEINLRFLVNLKIQILKGVVSVRDVVLIPGQDGGSLGSPMAGQLAEWMTCAEDEHCGNELPETFTDLIVLSSVNPALPNSSSMYTVMYSLPISHTCMDTSLLIHISTMTKPLAKILSEKAYKSELLRKSKSADFGLERVVLESNHQLLHRVFNNETFRRGGRFYGAYHLEMPKELRKHILLNGAPSVELDFSALHIRMLYHREGIDYREDPYRVVCETDDERKVFKLVQLIAINAESEKEAVHAIRDQLRRNGVYEGLSDQEILERLGRFKEGHPAIAKYLNAGIGLRLQNMDGRITDRVLTVMTKEGIPCLPVHDSYIVPLCYRDFLEEAMSEAYEEIMGFLPVIK